MISIFIAIAIRVFKSEKGNGIVNAILGYIIIFPTVIVVRIFYNSYLLRLTYLVYIFFIILGVIYGVALLVASKKYKSEVDELNRLLLKKKNIADSDEEE